MTTTTPGPDLHEPITADVPAAAGAAADAVHGSGFGPPDPALDAVGRQASARAVEIEQVRHLPADLVAGLVATGVFRR